MDNHLHRITIFHDICLFREKIYHIAVKLVDIISFYGRLECFLEELLTEFYQTLHTHSYIEEKYV